MTHKHKVFADAFLRTFDFEESCKVAKAQKSRTMVLLYDKDSEINKYIQERIDLYSLQTSFITNDFIKFKLGEIVISGDNQHKIQAAKILLGYDEEGDRTGDFINLMKALRG